LVACKQFSPSDYDSGYTCPHCAYRPTTLSGVTAADRLAAAKDRVSELWQNWVETLRDSVAAPEISGQLEVLAADERGRVEDLLSDRIAPGEISTELVATVKQLLNKFEIIHVVPKDMVGAVFPAGRAATVADAARTFEQWLSSLASKAGGDPARIRLVVDEDS
jgi:hypothetical protein